MQIASRKLAVSLNREGKELLVKTVSKSNSQNQVPTLRVNLFGGVDVKIGDIQVEPKLLSRQKVRLLLALLVLNRGHFMSSSRLSQMLYPESHPECARKSFYSAWSRLKSALTTPCGTRPYLIKQQGGYKIDSTFLSSDVLELKDVCTALLLGHAPEAGWSHLYARIKDTFACDFMSNDEGNPVVDALRITFRDNLVDALVVASKTLCDQGKKQEAAWFAQAAFTRDCSREDVYVALMRAQIACLQRNAALQTYFKCQKYLASELGIDPSPETVLLYKNIIEPAPKSVLD